MAENEEYEVLPHQLLEDLKYDVEELKKKLTQPDSKTQEVILEIESLKDSLRDLQEVFHKALEISKGEDLGQSIGTLRQKIDSVVQQNETIAKALLTISDKLDDFMQGKKSPAFAPQQQPSSAPGLQHQMGVPGLPGQRVAPRGPVGPSVLPPMPTFSGMPGAISDLPPPPAPPGGMKRKGIF